ncbi:hypothetical protein E3N88_42531 [Mikania micrantha]|uniref:Uncharacterized protein n=1 Tax=Mikania micrantha TaxID=192012 RepID=A0A5N6LHG9_9ASTR|nr:hypothetical protein E3N88_42531 [Mikania micrantha]
MNGIEGITKVSLRREIEHELKRARGKVVSPLLFASLSKTKGSNWLIKPLLTKRPRKNELTRTEGLFRQLELRERGHGGDRLRSQGKLRKTQQEESVEEARRQQVCFVSSRPQTGAQVDHNFSDQAEKERKGREQQEPDQQQQVDWISKKQENQKPSVPD